MKFNIKNNTVALILLPIIFWVIIYCFFHFDGLYGQDSYEYLRYTNALKNFLIKGENPGDYFWPLYYPVLGALLSLIVQNTGISLLLISVISLSVSGIVLHKLICLLYPQNHRFSTFYIIAFYTFSPYLLRSGMVVMSDMLATCFIVLTVYHFYKFRLNPSMASFYGITIFSVLAVMTRYACIIIVLPFIITALLAFFKSKRELKHILFLTLTVGVLILPHFIIRYANYDTFLSHPWLQTWSVNNFFKSSFTTVDGTSQNFYPNIFYAFSNGFHPGYLFLGLPFIVVHFIKRFAFKDKKILVLGFVMYALFLAGIPFQNNRFLLLSFPLVIIWFFPAFNLLIKKMGANYYYISVFLVLIIQSILVLRALKPVFERNKFEIEISKLLEPYQNQNLYSFEIDIALKGRELIFGYHNLWEKRYNDYKEGDLVLFHPTKFQKQWNGKNPIINWNHINSNYKLETVLNCPDGWKLYKIQSR